MVKSIIFLSRVTVDNNQWNIGRCLISTKCNQKSQLLLATRSTRSLVNAAQCVPPLLAVVAQNRCSSGTERLCQEKSKKHLLQCVLLWPSRCEPNWNKTRHHTCSQVKTDKIQPSLFCLYFFFFFFTVWDTNIHCAIQCIRFLENHVFAMCCPTIGL